ncbi:MAG: hypothetical protein EZS28_004203 [Streblomastix strix]|uniref:Clp1 P-loop domain-containing protein n=1 Tax=Streblomastix strix TaxID=222440 RepID=A0A5J4WYU7_9EUKA|nr:MAG: hypothetical protein EZS28_004203 [Streblomastix strix]
MIWEYRRLCNIDEDIDVDCDDDEYQQYLSQQSHIKQEQTSNPILIPLIVNTSGWIQGIAMHLLLDAISTVNPMYILQLTHNTIGVADIISKFVRDEQVPLHGFRWPQMNLNNMPNWDSLKMK